MNQIHYCIIRKTKVYYSHPTAFPSPSAMHIILLYLGTSIFRYTTTSPGGVHHHLTLISTNPSPMEPLQEQLAIKTKRSRNSNKKNPSLSLSKPRNPLRNCHHQQKSMSMPKNLHPEKWGQNVKKNTRNQGI